jgi:hypothetical protein
LVLAAGLKTSETSFTVAGFEWVAAEYFKFGLDYSHYKIRLSSQTVVLNKILNTPS